MTRAPSSPLQVDVAAALEWWREAGVDAAFRDEPAGWLVEPEADEPPPTRRTVVREAPPVDPEPQVGGPRGEWPRDLATFRAWWLAEPSLDEGGLAPRVAPVGEAGAELLVLVAMPEGADRDTLLSGAQGRLLDGFLHAAGLAPEKVYRASVLARHTPLPDWAAIERQGIGELLAHHIALARPKRLIAFGRNILPLCGHDPAQGTAASTFFNHEGGRVPALYEAEIERLLATASLRARLWKRWLDWTDGTTCERSGG